MTVRPILLHPAPQLRHRSVEVEWPLDKARLETLKDLTDTVRRLNAEQIEAAGLAAVQIGKLERMCALTEIATGKVRVLINPEVVSAPKITYTRLESCLSLPGQSVKVPRPEAIIVRSIHGTEHFHGFMARVVQHEIDHMDGRLIIDFKEVKHANAE